MRRVHPLRLLRALFIAPMTAPIWFWLRAAVGVLLDSSRRDSVLPHGGTAFLVVIAVGAPIAYAAALVAFAPAAWWLRRHRDWIGGLGCAGIGAVVGAALATVLQPWFRGELVSVPLPATVGAECGLVAGGVFWAVATR